MVQGVPNEAERGLWEVLQQEVEQRTGWRVSESFMYLATVGLRVSYRAGSFHVLQSPCADQLWEVVGAEEQTITIEEAGRILFVRQREDRLVGQGNERALLDLANDLDRLARQDSARVRETMQALVLQMYDVRGPQSTRKWLLSALEDLHARGHVEEETVERYREILQLWLTVLRQCVKCTIGDGKRALPALVVTVQQLAKREGWLQ